MKIYRTQDGGESRNASQICTQAEIVYLVTDVTDKDAECILPARHMEAEALHLTDPCPVDARERNFVVDG